MVEAYKETVTNEHGILSNIKCYIQRGDGVLKFCPPHYHTHMEFIYCLEGQFSTWLDNSHHNFGAGDMVAIGSEEVHMMRSVSSGSNSYIVLQVDPEVIYGIESRCTFPFMFGNNSKRKIFHHSELCATEIPKLFWQLYESDLKREFGHELEMKINICRIYLWLIRVWKSENKETENLSDSPLQHLDDIRKILDYIGAHYDEELSAQDMAKLANMSYSYFSRVFKRVTNRSFNDYLSMIRVNEAEKLLLMSDMSITQIAVSAGFSSSSYFIKIFSKMKGISPGKYRQCFNGS